MLLAIAARAHLAGLSGYRFSDHVKRGVPLDILFWIVTVVLASVGLAAGALSRVAQAAICVVDFFLK
jgi:hypothetical protein